MTATPRVFHINVKKKAQEYNYQVYDMDDESIYGTTFFSYTFRQAVEDGHLSDYRVIVFAVKKKDVNEQLFDYLQKGLSSVPDTAKMYGVAKALMGMVVKDNEEHSTVPIKRAILFCNSIKRARHVADQIQNVANNLNIENKKTIVAKLITGDMPASERKKLLKWLKEFSDEELEDTVKVLTNARVLTEGIDVPALDCVVFFDPRSSKVDIVQAIGRVMRKAKDKKYGYIVIPVIVPDEANTDVVNENEDYGNYSVVWEVASALRSLDEAFEADIKKLIIETQRNNTSSHRERSVDTDDSRIIISGTDEQTQQRFIQDIFPKLYDKFGKTYLKRLSKRIAEKTEEILNHLEIAIKQDSEAKKRFDDFLNALRTVINPSITEQEAKSMLVQHVITKPVFDALFEDYDFLRENLIASAIENIVKYFADFIATQTQDLANFYSEIRIRAKGIDHETERQDFLRQLYDEVFRVAFSDTADKLGIAYTPVELVDFVIKSADEILKNEFGKSLNDEKVFILEPFTGTGTFLTRLIDYLDIEALKRKYETGEIWGNEILLLPYYIALANVESTYYNKTNEYKPFKYLLLTDTFALDEKRRSGNQLSLSIFPKQYTDLMLEQNKTEINVIVSNPPWRARQEDVTDFNASVKYNELDKRISETYIKESSAKNKNAVYDSYVRAVRYASDRIGRNGIIAFVINNGFIDSNSFDGFRKSLEREFSKIYIFNLRGDARKQGEEWKKEGDKIFGQSSRAGVAILILVKNETNKNKSAEIYYYQVEDYMKLEEKLETVRKFNSIKNIPWQKLQPEDGIWLNKGTDEFRKFISVEDIFVNISLGIGSARDPWVYDYSIIKLREKMKNFITEYNNNIRLIKEGIIKTKEQLSKDKTKISWSETLVRSVFRKNAEEVSFESSGNIRKALYRPFILRLLYYSRLFIHSPGIFDRIFPYNDTYNYVITFLRTGEKNEFSSFASKYIVDDHLFSSINVIPLYIYAPENNNAISQKKLLNNNHAIYISSEKFTGHDGKVYTRYLNIKTAFYNKLKEHLKGDINPEDIFYYVYAVIINPEYGIKYANDLKREKPRVPMPENVEQFNKLVDAGKKLLKLHAHYEEQEEYPLEVEIKGDPDSIETYFPKVKKPDENSKGIIKYNDFITIKGIPDEVYEWKIGGKTILKWFADYLRPITDKDSNITIDPADYIKETGDKEYYIRLIKKTVYVAVETVKIVNDIKII